MVFGSLPDALFPLMWASAGAGLILLGTRWLPPAEMIVYGSHEYLGDGDHRVTIYTEGFGELRKIVECEGRVVFFPWDPDTGDPPPTPVTPGDTSDYGLE